MQSDEPPPTEVRSDGGNAPAGAATTVPVTTLAPATRPRVQSAAPPAESRASRRAPPRDDDDIK
jgi:hypothetical protein